MGEQITIFDVLYHDRLDPIKEVAKQAGPYWITSRQKLIDLCNTDPGIDLFAKAVRHEYCPYGLSGRLGGSGEPNTMEGWDMTPRNIKTSFWDAAGERKERIYSWRDFAREVADLIWSGEYMQEVNT